jgi:hypothetical protein
MTDQDDQPQRGNSSAREVELLTIRNLMRNESGRDFMWRCLQQSCIFGNVFDKDPLTHAYRAGAREQGLWLDREIKEAAPDEYLMMLREHFDG